MNAIGGALLDAVARGTAFAMVGLVLLAVVRRKGPGMSASVVLATLVGLAGVSALGAAPGLRWWSFAASAGSASKPERVATVDANDAPPEPVAAADPAAEPAATSGVSPGQRIAAAVRELGQAIAARPVDEEQRGWGWRAWAAFAALGAVAVGLGRFAIGLLAVGALRRRSRPVDDPEMRALATAIGDEIGVRGRVDLRVAPGLATPATIGWRRPVVLLPEDWTGWGGSERRVVLAHELAHVRRGDYLAGLWAQFSLALQYYHPLAHVLLGRLRLEQELAADACGARLAGGTRPYLATLARMALRNDPRPVGWPARSFRPVRGMFVRRIEMLRDAKEIRTDQNPRVGRLAALGVLAAAGLALAGFQGVVETNAASAAEGPVVRQPASVGVVDLGFIPPETVGFLSIRPAELLATPELKPLINLIDPDGRMRKDLPVSLDEIEQITIVWLPTFANGPGVARNRGFEPSGCIVRTAKPVDWSAFLRKGLPEMEEAKFGDYVYTRSARGPAAGCSATPDPKTLIFGYEGPLLRMLASSAGAADGAVWADAWKELKKGQVAMAFDPSYIYVQLRPAFAEVPRGVPSPISMLEPLLSRARGYAVSIDASKTVTLEAVATCNNDAGAKQVADTLRAAITLGGNALETMTRAEGLPALGPIAAVGKKMADKAEVVVAGKVVRLTSASDASVADVVKTILTPAVSAQRIASRRAQSVNNLKQIALAMHNYASVYNHFPPAVVMGPDGKTPHSWRVEILPYLEQANLYNEYKKDEPWDSPSNLKVLEKIPATFRVPGETGTNASYYVVVGESTLFSGAKGVGFAQITDGTSNTVMVVEAKRAIPWTKPEDIAFNPDPGNNRQPLPSFGGFFPEGFDALMADGSVRFLKDSIKSVVLKALLTKAGGEVISSDAF